MKRNEESIWSLATPVRGTMTVALEALNKEMEKGGESLFKTIRAALAGVAQ